MNNKKVMLAMVTPFTSNHEIDDESVVRLCHHFLSMNIDGIVVCGTTGEVSSLTFEEREHLFTLVKKTVCSKCELWMGCGTNNTDTTLKYCWQAEELGADGVMLITPYYVRPSQTGLLMHFSQIASKVKLPIMLYNVPKRTGVNLEVKTIIELVNRHSNIIALKQAHFDSECINRLLSETSLEVYCGDDVWYDKALELGMDGIVSVAGHLSVQPLRKMAEYHALGIHSNKLIEKWKNLSRMCFLVSSPCDIKTMLNMKGLCSDEVRLPLVKLNHEERQRIIDYMKKENL
ncbi:MAG: 4-hydroxy-tetrahydrodipicolinate synthase [Erysipelotrichaceae bacterium]|nr:4-hydroxy-tetrahydrodipicolinate synthase [Erysipelotrichaceae bacterium]